VFCSQTINKWVCALQGSTAQWGSNHSTYLCLHASKPTEKKPDRQKF